jgi:hypothetical protein
LCSLRIPKHQAAKIHGVVHVRLRGRQQLVFLRRLSVLPAFSKTSPCTDSWSSRRNLSGDLRAHGLVAQVAVIAKRNQDFALAIARGQRPGILPGRTGRIGYGRKQNERGGRKEKTRQESPFRRA